MYVRTRNVAQVFLLASLCLISGFRREVDENLGDVTAGCPETSLSNYHNSLRNDPEERSSHRAALRFSTGSYLTFSEILR